MNAFALTGEMLNSARTQLARRGRQLRSTIEKDGYRDVINRVRTAMADRIRPPGVTWHVFPDEVIAADLSRPPAVAAPKAAQGEQIVVNWIVGSASPGSGGHTTAYRMIDYLQRNGYRNRVYLYDPYGGDHKYYESIARDHYGMTCEIGNARDGMADAHAVVATNWPSAYAAYTSTCAGKRFYFVQDYEPFFYPVGTNSVLAENTYRMGFHGITAGSWLAQKLSNDFGMTADHFPFGCDTARYRRDPSVKRSGIAFYARAGTPRRAVEIGLLALELFAKRQPDIKIHLYGERFGELPFKFVNHGLVRPAELNAIYNSSFAGLSLSMTNVSLVPHEMLASGCIPVVNDEAHNRMVLDNSYVRYAPATPHQLSAALEAIVMMPDFAGVSEEAAASVALRSWDDAGDAVHSMFQRTLRAH